MSDPEAETGAPKSDRHREDQTRTATGDRASVVLERIGPYRLLEVLGEGGMGVVYHAEQVEPVARRVALKIIKLGMETKEVVARFEAERQAVALMDHPSIARVFDAGATETGRPYFVMELVRGLPITDYCDRERLTTQERLRLFIQVCQAIQHAHQKGVIHRDLKPSNILVTIQDGRPVPKIIDFGIAKALHRRLTDQTLVTHMGDIMGTPAFMSPEQLEGASLDVDTRADIYSLGVTLYLLLSGHLPFETDEIQRAAGVASHLREHDPPRPSARVTTARSPKSLAESRRTDALHLRRALSGDLDWIVLKAMARDRSARYETANGLALDLERHLSNEPVIARPPSAAYRARKFVRRHRMGVAFAAVLVGTLLGFAVAVVLQARRVSRERDRAETEAAKAAAVSQFLQETLGAADPWASGRDPSVREALGEAAAKVGAAFEQQPLVAAAVRRTLGLTYQGLGRYADAEPLLRSALETRRTRLGSDHPDVSESLLDLGATLVSLTRYEEAEAQLREALLTRRRVFGEKSLPAALALRQLSACLFARGEYASAESTAREALEIQRKLESVDPLELASTLATLSTAVGQGRGASAEAEVLLREALGLRRQMKGEHHPTVAQTLNDVAVVRLQQEDYEGALDLYQQALAIGRASLGDDHPETAATLENLGGVYFKTGRFDESLAAVGQVLDIRRRKLGPESLAVARTLHNRAVVETSAGRLASAEATFTEALPRMRAILGADHPEVAQALSSWAKLKKDEKDLSGAERLFREALALRVKKLGEGHAEVARNRVRLAGILVLLRRFPEAEALLLAMSGDGRKVDERVDREAKAELVKLYEAWGRPAEAEKYKATPAAVSK